MRNTEKAIADEIALVRSYLIAAAREAESTLAMIARTRRPTEKETALAKAAYAAAKVALS